jgi:alpha/beta superfamily hydrolase
MVMKGQFLERPTLLPVTPSEVMEGLSHRGEKTPPLLIVPPRPEEGGSMDHVVAAEVAWAVAMGGHPTLRFNFRGVGASQGTRGGTQAQIDDVQAALRVIEENVGVASPAVLTIGGSAWTALHAQKDHPGISGLCFVSPVGLDLADLPRLSVPLLVIIGEHDNREPRAALAAAVTEAGGTIEVIPAADPTFNRNLPQVGKAALRWLDGLSSGYRGGRL